MKRGILSLVVTLQHATKVAMSGKFFIMNVPYHRKTKKSALHNKAEQCLQIRLVLVVHFSTALEWLQHLVSPHHPDNPRLTRNTIPSLFW